MNEAVSFKRSAFRNGWTTFNIRNEDADEAERRLAATHAGAAAEPSDAVMRILNDRSLSSADAYRAIVAALTSAPAEPATTVFENVDGKCNCALYPNGETKPCNVCAPAQTPQAAGAIEAREQEVFKLPPMPETIARRPRDDNYPEGYLESDDSWTMNNPEVIRWLADNHAAIRAVLSSAWETPPAAGAAQAVTLPAYGALPWETVRAYVEAAVGSRPIIDPEYFIGHQIVGINYNSLNRIMSALAATPAPEVAGVHTLSEVVRLLRKQGHYEDEEGEATNHLADLLDALKAAHLGEKGGAA